MYTERLSPFFSEQQEKWDYLGEIARDPSYLFYYLMSLPLRLIQSITDSYFIHVLSLRIMMLSVFIAGLVAYRKLLIRVTKSKPITHIALLVFTLLPVYATFNAVVNYDIIVFTLTPVFLWLFLDLVKVPFDTRKWSYLVFIGGFTSLIKFSFLPVFAAAFFIILHRLWTTKRSTSLRTVKGNYLKQPTTHKIIIVLLVALTCAAIVERPVYNQLVYGRVTAPCVKVLSKERCLENYTAARSIRFREAKPDNFSPVNPLEYLLTTWSIGMTRTQMKVIPDAKTYAHLETLFYISTISGTTLILINLKKLLRNRSAKYILILSVAYLGVLFIENFGSYVRSAQPVAISARYMMLFAPFLIALAIMSFRDMFANYQKFMLLVFTLFMLVLLTQGGGISSHLLSGQDFYWQSGIMDTINNRLMPNIQQLIIERRILW
jgi:hypothetical protein